MARHSAESRVQAAQAASVNEITQLKATAAALREQLEMTRVSAEASVQVARQASQDEIAQLHASIVAMRETMERHTATQ